jgi:macrodomain Ter protein organizer (MatP/YcbG family)
MPRPRTGILASDSTHAIRYLSTKVRLFEIDASPKQVRELLEIEFSGSKTERLAALNDWCEQVLSTEQWASLKTAIRKRRQRKLNDDITITISRKAHDKLSKIAERDNVTLSQAIERNLRVETSRR